MLAGVAVAWVLMLVLAPVAVAPAAAGGARVGAGQLVYLAGRLVCHQQPARSFALSGVTLPVCGRCLGIYLGAAAAGAVLAWPGRWGRGTPATRRVARAGVLAAAVPTAVTLAVEGLGLVDPGNIVRAAAGMPLGVAGVWLVSGVLRGTLH